MKCPTDKADMIVVEHKKIELDYCLKCAGVWFDRGELELLLGTSRASADKSGGDPVKGEEAKVSEAKRKCPICGKKMDKVWLGKTPKVLIDSCPIGDGLWFDGGELSQILKQIGPVGNPEEVLSFLGDAFQGGREQDGHTTSNGANVNNK